MSSLKLVFLGNRPEIVRFLRARSGSAAEADDIAQELWLKLDGQPIGPVAEPRAYLYRMANNLLLDRRRSDARRTRRNEDWCGDAAGIDTRPDAEAALIARERLRIVHDALAELPERTNAVFRRFRIDGEPQRAIAADLGISVSAVEKHLQRAYQVVIGARQRLDADLTLS